MSSIKESIGVKKLKVKKSAKIVIVRSDYHSEITQKLEKSCIIELKKAGATERNIKVLTVPGAWEIPFACQMISRKKPDVIIALGCIIKGETPHFDFIAKEVSRGIMDLSLKKNVPIIFGVLTTLNHSQARARVQEGKCCNKGIEAAQAAIRIINLK